MNHAFDVIIVGGGPAGTTCGTLLKKYNPNLNVALFEREAFPRDHVGESQLPIVSQVLHEMGVWDKVEGANFPVKIGATYRWGLSDQLWNFEFLANGDFGTEARPAKYEGQRQSTAFQVDRSVYDKILLDHCREMGVKVFEKTRVVQVLTDQDKVTGVQIDESAPSAIRSNALTARYYVDATGGSGLFRRALKINSVFPTKLQNVAIWDYWQDAKWAESIGIGGTRIRILSLGYGWIWFIPVSATRSSIGLVVPASYVKEAGKSPTELYAQAVKSDPVLSELLSQATPEGKLATTRDWSFLADRLVGENWFLCGESAGFADPILSAGMTLAHMGARDVAYTILALDRKDFEPHWLRSRYEEGQREKIRQHIRFADFWYSANGQFSDLKDHSKEIAKDIGLDLTPDEAWQWLGTGGFVSHEMVGASFGGYSLRAAKKISGNFLGTEPRFKIAGQNVFELNLDGAEKRWGATLENGRIGRHRAYYRNGRYLPKAAHYGVILNCLKPKASAIEIWNSFNQMGAQHKMTPDELQRFFDDGFDALESMVADGWVRASFDPSERPLAAPAINDSYIRAHVKA